MNAFLLRCLEKEYTDRYRNFDDVLAALDGKQVSTSSKLAAPNRTTNAPHPYLKKAIFGSIGLVALILVVIFAMNSGKDEKHPQSREIASVSVPVKQPDLFTKKESRASYKAAISDFDKKIRSMQKRLNDKTPQSSDSLKALNDLIIQKQKEESKLAAFISKEKADSARRKKLADEVFMKQLKADIQDYKNVVKSEYGKTMKATAWQTLADKYLTRSKGVEVGDTTTLLYGFSVLKVKTKPKDAKISLLNVKQVFSQGMRLKAGEYRVKVSKKGYSAKEFKLTLKAGKTKQVSVELVAFGRLYMSTNPKNARVKVLNVKGKYRDGMQLPPGEYRVEVSAKGSFTKRLSVKVGAGENRKLNVKLSNTNSLGMKFVYIKPGSFMMGSPASGRDSDEVQHRVTLSKGFYMQTTEVTQGQWRAVMGTNPSHFKTCGDNCPVEQVSWNDAKDFIRKLNTKEGAGKYRLPTEAEWEYACRAGSDTKYAGGNSLDQMGWYSKNAGSKTHSVGQKKVNAWGLYDMHGNVWEWCEDWKGEYPSGTVTDPEGAGSGSYRVRRGGGWYSLAKYCRSARRLQYSPGGTFYRLGFRLARAL